MKEQKKPDTARKALLFSEAVSELCKSNITVLLYSYDNPLVSNSLNKAYQCFEKIFKDRTEITLKVEQDRLIFEDRELKSNTDFKDFARGLNKRGIDSVTFRSGLSREGLIAFHKKIALGNFNADELEKYIKDENIDTIIVRSLKRSVGEDKDKNDVLEMDRFASALTGDARRQDLHNYETWEMCISSLLEGKISETDKEIVRSIPPEHMAHILNAMYIENAGDSAYERLISCYLQASGEDMSKDSGKEKKLFLERLKPEIQNRFLILLADRNKLSGSIHDGLSKDRGLSGEGLPVETVSAYDTENTFPDFTMLPELEFNFTGRGKSVIHDIEMTGDIIPLFEEKNIRKFMSRSYQQKLSLMLEPVADITRFMDECKEEVLQGNTVGILFELIESDHVDTDSFMKILTKLSQVIEAFMDTGRFENVLDTYNTLSSYSLQGKYSQLASSMINYFFHSERFIEKLVQAFRIRGRKDRESAKRLTRVLRSSLMGPLLNALEVESRPSMRRFIIYLLASTRSDALPHVVERLKDNRWYVLRNMLYLLRECKGKKYIPNVKEFLKHQMPLVCLEALRTLLNFQAPEAIVYTVKYLKGDNRQLRRGAVRLAGAYRVKESVPYLLGILEEADILGTKISYKKDVLRALGRIGDSSAIPRLMDICRSFTLIYREDFEKLKLEIFKTLYKYPLADLMPLLEYGMQSGNMEVVAISKRLLDRYNKSIADKWLKYGPEAP